MKIYKLVITMLGIFMFLASAKREGNP